MPPHIAVDSRFNSCLTDSSDREDSCRSDELDSIEREDAATTTTSSSCRRNSTNSITSMSNHNTTAFNGSGGDVALRKDDTEYNNNTIQPSSLDSNDADDETRRSMSEVVLVEASTQPPESVLPPQRRRSMGDLEKSSSQYKTHVRSSSMTMEEALTMKNKGANATAIPPNLFALLGSSPPFQAYDSNSDTSTDAIDESVDDEEEEAVSVEEDEEEETVATSAPTSGQSLTTTSTFRTKKPSATMLRSRLLNRLGIKDNNTMMMENVGKMNPTDPSLSILAKDVTSRSYTELLKADFGKPDVHLVMKAKTKQLPSLAHFVRGGSVGISESYLKQQEQQPDEQRDPSVSSTSRVVATSPSSVSSSLTEATITTKPTPHSIMMGRSGNQRTKKQTNNIRFQVTVQVHTIPDRHAYSKRIRATLWTSSTEMQHNTARNSYEYAAEGWDYRTVADDEDMVIIATGEKIHPIHFIHQQQEEQQQNDENEQQYEQAEEQR